MTTAADAEGVVSSSAADPLGATFELEWNGSNQDASVRVNGVDITRAIHDCKIEIGDDKASPVVTLTACASRLKSSLKKADVRIVARDPVSGAEISFGELLDLVPAQGPASREHGGPPATREV